MKKPINLNRLRAFVAIARAKSFGAAAAELGVSQPTLSLQLSQLEDDYQARLIDRPARPLSLTPLGEELFAVALPLVAIEERAVALLDGSAALEHSFLAVAADAPQHVLAALARFTALYPGVETSLTTGNSEQVLARLTHHDADVAVVADADKSPAFYREPLHRDRVIAVVSRDHALFGRRYVTPKSLANETLIEREAGSRTRAIVKAALAGVSPRRSIELSSREAVIEAAALGLGVGFVFESELSDRRLHAVTVRGPDMSATEYWLCRRERKSEAAIAAFASALRHCHGAS